MTKNMEIEIAINYQLLYFILLAIFLIYSFYLSHQVAMKNPISFGDEGFHTSLGRYIAVNKEYPKYIPFEGTILIKDSFHRPPLWNLLLAGFMFIFGANDFVAKIITLLIAFFLGISTYILTKKIFNENVALISSIFIVSFQSVLTYTVLFYYTLLLLFFANLALLCFMIYVKENNKKFLILAGLFSSLALLTNQFAITLYVIFFLYILYTNLENLRNLRLIIKEYFPFLLILLIIPSGYIIRNLILYKTPVCFSIPYLRTIFDTSHCKIQNFEEKFKFVGQAIPIGTEATAFSIGFTNYLEFAYFDTKFVILPLLIGLCLLFLSPNRINILLIICFIIYVILMLEVGRGRAEDTARYSLGFAGVVALISAITYNKIIEVLSRFHKYLPFIMIVLLILFCSLVVKKRLDELNIVKAWDPSFFEACAWIKHNIEKDATISTIWGHNGAWCSERNMGPMLADIMLSYDLDYILKVVKENKIDYFWIQKGSIDPLNRGYAGNYPLRFIRILVENPQYFIKVYENGENIENCFQACRGQTIYKINVTNI